MNYLLKDFKKYLIENEEKYKNGLRDSIEYQLGYTEVKEIVEEIERLNNIINELEKELDRGYRDLFEYELVPGRELITNIKNYLQELKGSDKK